VAGLFKKGVVSWGTPGGKIVAELAYRHTYHLFTNAQRMFDRDLPESERRKASGEVGKIIVPIVLGVTIEMRAAGAAELEAAEHAANRGAGEATLGKEFKFATPEPYEGVREASAIMRREGVPRKIRKQVLESFDRRAMAVRPARPGEYGLRFYDDVVAKPRARYLFETFPASRGSLGLKLGWNRMTRLSQWRIREGATLFEGPTAEQGLGLAGGKTQKYVLHLEDILEPFE